MRPIHESHSPLVFDRAGIRDVDRRAIEDYGMNGLVLMENAASGASQLALELLDCDSGTSKVVIACGPGNNGGDGYAMARHLHNAGCSVTILAQGEPRSGSDAETNAHIAMSMGLEPVEDVRVLANADLVVDALLGTGLDRPVNEAIAKVIQAINETTGRTLAVDVPSGLDSNTGRPLGTAVRATATATFVGWKSGFLADGAAAFTGALHVVDIGIPMALARLLCLKEPC
ncbi:MAG: NAD(P)H-hydrate epimerase [Planctomycetota bacterium]|nr:NAD(P)H-hydrate epimerase [Planctomycetota bacterium]